MTRPPGHPGRGEPYPDNGPGGPDRYSGNGYEYHRSTSDPSWDGYPEYDTYPVPDDRYQRAHPRPETVDLGGYGRPEWSEVPHAGSRDIGDYDRFGGERWPGSADRGFTDRGSGAPGWAGAPSSGVPLSEQPTTYLPAVPGYDPPRPSRRPGSGRPAARLVVAVAGVVVLLVAGLLLVSGSGSGPDETSAPPDLAKPAGVVDRWLTAMFIQKDPAGMLRYTCEREADRARIDDAIRSVRKAERDAKVARLAMKVNWSEPAEVSKDGDQAKVRAVLTVAVGKRTQKTPANFGLVFEAGWRVCDTDLA